MMEKRSSERDLMNERFHRLLDHSRLLAEHILKVRPNDLQHQYVMFPVRALDSEMIQETEDPFGSGMGPGLGRKMAINLDLVVRAGELCHCELEGDVLTVIE